MYSGTYSTVDDIGLWQKLASQELIHFDRRRQEPQFYQTHNQNLYHKLKSGEKPKDYLL